MLSNNTNRSNQCIKITVFATKVWTCGSRCMGGGDTGTMSYMSRKAIDRFQCTWVAMIGEMYELIAEYLGNGFR